MYRPYALILTPAVLAAALCSQARVLDPDRAPGAAAVSVDHCKEWLGTLASPEFEGRGTGQEGFRKAAEYVREHFAKLGLRPLGDDGTYFQTVPWVNAKVDPQNTSLEFVAKDGTTVYVPAERLAGSVSQSLDASGQAVLLVLPPQAERPRRQSDDEAQAEADDPWQKILEGVDLKDKVVLLHVQPGEDQRNRAFRGFRATNAVQDKEPAAVLVLESAAVRGGLTTRSGPGAGAANRAVRGARIGLPSLRFGGDDCMALLEAANAKDALGTTGATELGMLARVKATVETENKPAFNVVGVLPGSDETLADEYVVIGSHLDHLGRRGDNVFPGADDDASGTTGVLAVATMFAKNPVRPKRSIMFLCFCGEENGLVGSRFLADNPPIPLSAMVAELQMDMIGRNEEGRNEKAEDNVNCLHLVGTQKLSRDLHELCMAKNEVAGFELEWDEENVFSRSDHASFARHGIPIAFFFTGFHRDYHQTSDTPDKIEYEKLLRVATYVYDIAFELGTMQSRPLVDEDLWEANRGSLRGPETPAAPVRRK